LFALPAALGTFACLAVRERDLKRARRLGVGVEAENYIVVHCDDFFYVGPLALKETLFAQPDARRPSAAQVGGKQMEQGLPLGR